MIDMSLKAWIIPIVVVLLGAVLAWAGTWVANQPDVLMMSQTGNSPCPQSVGFAGGPFDIYFRTTVDEPVNVCVNISSDYATFKLDNICYTILQKEQTKFSFGVTMPPSEEGKNVTISYTYIYNKYAMPKSYTEYCPYQKSSYGIWTLIQ
jgi:hypothetical protein